MTLANFEEVLHLADRMAVEGSYFLGELPAWLPETEIGQKVSVLNYFSLVFICCNQLKTLT